MQSVGECCIVIKRQANKPDKMNRWPVGQAVKTPPSHGGNRGSIPLLAVKMSENTVFSDIFLFDRKGTFLSNKKYDYAHLRAGETAFLRKSIA